MHLSVYTLELSVKSLLYCSAAWNGSICSTISIINYSKLSEIIEPSLFSCAMVCVGAEEHRKKSERVLVFSELGISRAATAVTAYLIHRNKCSFKVSAPCYFGNGGEGGWGARQLVLINGRSQTLALSPGILEKGTHCLGSCVHMCTIPPESGESL